MLNRSKESQSSERQQFFENLNEELSCGPYFQPETLELLGGLEARCIWRSARHLLVQFGSRATIGETEFATRSRVPLTAFQLYDLPDDAGVAGAVARRGCSQMCARDSLGYGEEREW